MVHDVTGAVRTVGLDTSAEHVARARSGSPPGLDFMVHDVTVVPFPSGPAGVVYARLVLAHLRDPAAVIARWSTQLDPGGVLLLDDLESIETDDEVFRTYLDEVALAVVRRAGGALLVGPEIHAVADPAGTVRLHDEVATFAPPAPVTARIFGMNLAVLVDRGEAEARPDLTEGLVAIAEGTRPAPAVSWRMRQVAFRRG